MDDKHINPDHYKLEDGRQAIDMVKELLTEEEFAGYLKGSKMKYQLRAGKKRHITDEMALSFLRVLPNGNEAIMVDDVKRHFTLWQAYINNAMVAVDLKKQMWFEDKLKK